MPTYTGIIRGTVTDSIGQQAYADLPVNIVVEEPELGEPLILVIDTDLIPEIGT